MVLLAPEWNGRARRSGCHPTLYPAGDLVVEVGIDRLAVRARPGTREIREPGQQLSIFTGRSTLTGLVGEITLWRPNDGSHRVYAYHLHPRAGQFGADIQCVGVCVVPHDELDWLRVIALAMEPETGCCRCASPSGGLLAATHRRLIRFHCTVNRPPRLPEPESRRSDPGEPLHLGGWLAPADADGWPPPEPRPVTPRFTWLALWTNDRGRMVGGLERLRRASAVDRYAQRTAQAVLTGRDICPPDTPAIREALEEVGSLGVSEPLREL
jgi:hypothetical protein